MRGLRPLALALCAMLLPLGSTSWAQEPLQGPEVTTKLHEVTEEYRVPRMAGEYVVDGNKIFDGWFLSVKRLEFRPGSTLTFSKDALRRGHLFVLAEEIVSVDQANPGKITFAKAVPDAPGGLGTAGPGDRGSGQGDDGRPGTTGGTGATGVQGADGPNLTLITFKLGSPLIVDLRGGKGGPGGSGQTGGRGGDGRQGSPASSGAFDCKRGAGDGGNGGPGGRGGKGGTGGRGGSGGTFTLIVPAEDVPLATRSLQVDISGGDPGDRGPGGVGGSGGHGGRRGQEARPYCRDDGRDGSSGSQGATGEKGDPGTVGSAGNYYVGSLSPDDLERALE